MFCFTFFFREIENLLQSFLKSKEAVIYAVGEIFLEAINVGGLKKFQVTAKGISVVAGAASIVSFALIPVTGGLSSAPGTALAVVGATAGVVSLGARIHKAIVEKGLYKKLQSALDKNEKITKRLQYVAESLRDVACITKCTGEFIDKIVKLGLATAKEVAVWQSWDISLQAARILQAAQAAKNILKYTTGVLALVSVPFEICSFVIELKDLNANKLSQTAQHIWDRLLVLQEEYTQFKTEIETICNYDIEGVVKALNGDINFVI